MVSHELRAPTSAILGWAELIGRTGIDKESVEQGLEAIKRNAHLQVDLIKQLVDFAALHTGGLKIQAQKIALVPSLEAALDTVSPLALAKPIELQVKLDRSAGPVIGDAARLQQVFTNLLQNAIKFTPSGGRVELGLARRSAYAEVRVSDTGRGISAEFLPYVFERFRQSSAGQTDGDVGLGLGLAIARDLVERHRGKIYADSRGEGHGATFTVHLPLGNEAIAEL